jgi:hypothetical protein
MNGYRVLVLATRLEAVPHVMYDVERTKFATFGTAQGAPSGFNMQLWGAEVEGCGTVACIGGWAESMWPSDANALDLTYDQKQELFFPSGRCTNFVTPQRAAGVLRNLAETGRVDWDCDAEAA